MKILTVFIRWKCRKIAEITEKLTFDWVGPLSRDNNAEGIVFRKRLNNQETFSGG